MRDEIQQKWEVGTRTQSKHIHPSTARLLVGLEFAHFVQEIALNLNVFCRLGDFLFHFSLKKERET